MGQKTVRVFILKPTKYYGAKQKIILTAKNIKKTEEEIKGNFRKYSSFLIIIDLSDFYKAYKNALRILIDIIFEFDVNWGNLFIINTAPQILEKFEKTSYRQYFIANNEIIQKCLEFQNSKFSNFIE